jgi:hypothetical protein
MDKSFVDSGTTFTNCGDIAKMKTSPTDGCKDCNKVLGGMACRYAICDVPEEIRKPTPCEHLFKVPLQINANGLAFCVRCNSWTNEFSEKCPKCGGSEGRFSKCYCSDEKPSPSPEARVDWELQAKEMVRKISWYSDVDIDEKKLMKSIAKALSAAYEAGEKKGSQQLSNQGDGK